MNTCISPQLCQASPAQQQMVVKKQHMVKEEVREQQLETKRQKTSPWPFPLQRQQPPPQLSQPGMPSSSDMMQEQSVQAGRVNEDEAAADVQEEDKMEEAEERSVGKGQAKGKASPQGKKGKHGRESTKGKASPQGKKGKQSREPPKGKANPQGKKEGRCKKSKQHCSISS